MFSLKSFYPCVHSPHHSLQEVLLSPVSVNTTCPPRSPTEFSSGKDVQLKEADIKSPYMWEGLILHRMGGSHRQACGSQNSNSAPQLMSFVNFHSPRQPERACVCACVCAGGLSSGGDSGCRAWGSRGREEDGAGPEAGQQ